MLLLPIFFSLFLFMISLRITYTPCSPWRSLSAQSFHPSATLYDLV